MCCFTPPKIASYAEVGDDPAPWQALQGELRALWYQYENTEAIRNGKAAAAKKSDKTA